MSTYLEGLQNELAYLKQQPSVNETRVSEVEAEIERVNPTPVEDAPAAPAEDVTVEAPADAPKVERAVDEPVENTAGPASSSKK